ncbi:MAG: hypothetical protein GYA46_07425 [candidate division Zixibacteria bacterium]|nr:hypothetical protein [candidate division Zixibacteria bacterium]
MKNHILCVLPALALSLCLTVAVDARALFDSPGDGGLGISPKIMNATPNTQYDQHNVGKMALLITNYGTFGFGYVSSPIINGEEALGCEYPINSQMEYLFAATLWIGAIVGRDTLVSVGGDGWFQMKELYPDSGDAGSIITRSSLKSKNTYSAFAVSEQDFLCTYSDTFTETGLTGSDPIDNRPHIPLNISIQQNSYSWSYDYAEDFVILDFKITNIGAFPIRQLYAAIYVDADVYHSSTGNNGAQDDICGFRRTAAMPADYCITEDTINIAWIADNDGDPTQDGNWSFTSPTAVTGSRVLRSPNEDLEYSFNWWISNTTPTFDFGPRMAGTNEKPFRSFGAHMGTPTGDRNKYYTMSNGEFDYDQLFTAISHTGEGYMPPPKPDLAIDLANGYDTRYLLSFGPFDVQPGDTLPITIAYIAGDNFHVGAQDFQDEFDAFNPSIFYSKLDFSDFGTNSRWASWIFDNPGVDTDTSDSYGRVYPPGQDDSGKFCMKYTYVDTTIWVLDTTVVPAESTLVDTLLAVDSLKMYYAGDGVPDFRGASPPPPPTIHVIPGFGQVTLRWNGQESQNAYDVFARQRDFEGFRVYYAQGDRAQDYVLLASYDLDDYKVYQYNDLLLLWEQVGTPLTMDSLRTLYGPDFLPLNYTSEFDYFVDPHTSKLLYFRAQDWNQSDLSDPRGIHKVYPTASRTDPTDTTSEGFLRYYEYEYVIPNLLPSIPYNFSVTAFDFGSLKTDMGALESSPLTNAVKEYPLPSADEVQANGLGAIVYPNPYRIDAGYADAGFENRDRDRAAERSRAIHFANLPRVCTIRIFTLSGDLVREISHNYPDGGPQSQHEEWDVISRNTQAVVTGLYLYQIESEFGTQVGKLVIIK